MKEGQARELIQVTLRNGGERYSRITVDDVDIEGIDGFTTQWEVIDFLKRRISAAERRSRPYKWHAPPRRTYLNRTGRADPRTTPVHVRLQDQFIMNRPMAAQ